MRQPYVVIIHMETLYVNLLSPTEIGGASGGRVYVAGPLVLNSCFFP